MRRGYISLLVALLCFKDKPGTSRAVAEQHHVSETQMAPTQLSRVEEQKAIKTGLPRTPCIYQSRRSVSLVVDQELDQQMFNKQETQPRSYDFLASTQAQMGTTAAQRATVLDSMIAAAASLGLSSDSMFAGAAYFDAYLATNPTLPQLLQPLSIACLWLGTKYEQLVTPPAACFAQYVVLPADMPSGRDAAQELLILLEGCVLEALDYRLAAFVTIKAFVRRIMQLVANLMEEDVSAATAGLAGEAAVAAGVGDRSASKEELQYSQLYFMTSYLAEVCLLEYNLLQYKPSELAAACFGFAHVLLGMHLDAKLFQQITHHNMHGLEAPMQWLCALHATLASAMAVSRPYWVSVKYMKPHLCSVAAVAPVRDEFDSRLQVTAQLPHSSE